MSDRQHEVLHMVAEGKTNRQIAAKLDLSPKTVEHYVTDVLMVLGVPNRAAAVHEGHRRGLL